MSENLILLSSFDTIRKKFNVPNIESNEPITKRLISGDDQAWVLKTGYDSLTKMKFGFTPEYALKRLDMLNLRTDQLFGMDSIPQKNIPQKKDGIPDPLRNIRIPSLFRKMESLTILFCIFGLCQQLKSSHQFWATGITTFSTV